MQLEPNLYVVVRREATHGHGWWVSETYFAHGCENDAAVCVASHIHLLQSRGVDSDNMLVLWLHVDHERQDFLPYELLHCLIYEGHYYSVPNEGYIVTDLTPY